MRSAWITVAGVAAGVVFTAGWIAAGIGSSTADSVNGTLSDLGSSGADRPWIWNAARTISGVLVIAVAVGVFRKLPRRRDAAVAAAPARAARRGRRRRPCGHYRPYSWRNIGHELVSPFGSLGLVVALALFAPWTGHRPAHLRDGPLRVAGRARGHPRWRRPRPAQVVRTPTTSRTAAAEAARASCSSSVRSSSTISSMPDVPSLTGTPM
jgi:hypothetical protein